MPEEQRTQGESAGASVKAAAKTGKAVSDIAKGAATGGAHGAALATVKHSKKWIEILVGLLLLPILIVAMLPVIIFGSLFGTGTDTPSGITDDTVLTQNMWMIPSWWIPLQWSATMKPTARNFKRI